MKLLLTSKISPHNDRASLTDKQSKPLRITSKQIYLVYIQTSLSPNGTDSCHRHSQLSIYQYHPILTPFYQHMHTYLVNLIKTHTHIHLQTLKFSCIQNQPTELPGMKWKNRILHWISNESLPIHKIL